MKTTAATIIRARAALGRGPDRSEDVADQLRSLGFQVETVSPRGVGFAGSADLFRAAFQAEVAKTDRGVEFASSPSLPNSLTTAGASVYFPTRPEYYP